MDLVLARGLAVHISHKASQAADAVAAHLWLTAVAVEDAHGEVCGADCWQGKDHLRSHPVNEAVNVSTAQHRAARYNSSAVYFSEA
jgi:hypothetical protein